MDGQIDECVICYVLPNFSRHNCLLEPSSGFSVEFLYHFPNHCSRERSRTTLKHQWNKHSFLSLKMILLLDHGLFLPMSSQYSCLDKTVTFKKIDLPQYLSVNPLAQLNATHFLLHLDTRKGKNAD